MGWNKKIPPRRVPKTKSAAPPAPTKHTVPCDNFGVRRGGGGAPPPPLWGRVPARASPRGTGPRGFRGRVFAQCAPSGALSIHPLSPNFPWFRADFLQFGLSAHQPSVNARLTLDADVRWEPEEGRGHPHTTPCPGTGGQMDSPSDGMEKTLTPTEKKQQQVKRRCLE